MKFKTLHNIRIEKRLLKNNMEDKIIIQSRQKCWVYPVILVAAFLVFDLCTDCGFIYDLITMPSRNPRKGYFIVFLLSAIPIGASRLWFMRRVKVYDDRIEVKYLLHRKWNYQVILKDVDCCCTEIVEKKEKNDTYQYNRIYLLTGKKLWLYISESDGSNFKEMLSVLTDHFGIPIRKGSINLSAEEMKTVKHGGYISLEDISEEELAEMDRQRRKRPQPGSDLVISSSTKRKYFLIEYGVMLLIAALLVAILAFMAFREANSVSLSCIDAKTELPSKLYYTVDSVDVDSCGLFCFSSYKIVNVYSKLNEKAIYKRTNHWAFHVKGRNDVWITVAVEDREDIPSPVYYRDDYCIKKLHQKHTYRTMTYDDDNQKVIEEIAKTAKTKIDGNIQILTMEKPISTGRALYVEALELKKGKKPDYQKAFSLMEQAAEEIAAAQYELGLMYEDGKGITADSEKAIRMYELAAGQDYDIRTKIDAMNQMSYVYAGRGKYRKAIEIIDSAIVVAPQEANLYDSKGEHLYKYGDREGAKKMWERVVELDPQFMENHNSELYRLLYEK